MQLFQKFQTEKQECLQLFPSTSSSTVTPNGNQQLALREQGSGQALSLPPLSTAVAMTTNKLKDLDEALLNIGPDMAEGV
jgi:hypothetical protein